MDDHIGRCMLKSYRKQVAVIIPGASNQSRRHIHQFIDDHDLERRFVHRSVYYGISRAVEIIPWRVLLDEFHLLTGIPDHVARLILRLQFHWSTWRP